MRICQQSLLKTLEQPLKAALQQKEIPGQKFPDKNGVSHITNGADQVITPARTVRKNNLQQ